MYAPGSLVVVVKERNVALHIVVHLNVLAARLLLRQEK